MSVPAPLQPMMSHVDIPCCSPATTESVAVVRDKVSDARADILVGHGSIMKNQGDSTSAILRDANANTLAINGTTDRGIAASMSHTDKFGLAGLQATQSEADRLSGQASTIAWNQSGITGAGFAEARGATSDSFARLSAQGENGFYRTSSSLHSGFTDAAKTAADSYARLSEQNCTTKETVAAYGNRSSDQHAALSRDICTLGKDVTLQASSHYGSLQLEASRNTGAIQLQAALNAKDSLLEQSKWFALAEKTAMINKCELEAKLAACCCEIKEVVTGSANATHALIQATEATRVRDALSAASTENAILKLRREEHHHYPPYYHHQGGNGSRRGSRGN